MPNNSKQASRPIRPAQTQSRQPGRQRLMKPEPITISSNYRPAGKLRDKVALITGGDSGIGRSVAVGFAHEGAKVAIVYLEEDDDARQTQGMVEAAGSECLLIRGDVGRRAFCRRAIERTVRRWGGLDILVNNAAEQHPADSIRDITEATLRRTFETNVFSMFYLCQEALEHLKARKGASIINTTSVTAYRGSPGLLDYSATKGAIVAFTRSLSGQLARLKPPIRVNAVAPGPIWTPLIPATFDGEKVAEFGSDTPLGRAGEPAELVGAFVYLASDDSSYVTGQVIHVNGGEIVNA